MVDFGTAAHGDYFSITDTYDPLSNRKAFFDTSHVLPAVMLETYVEKWPTPRVENFRYMLRSGMMGWLTIMMDTTTWSAEQHAEAKKEIELYKESSARSFATLTYNTFLHGQMVFTGTASSTGTRLAGVE
jgi:alpha-galactosidase